jgi:hypothetical protein
LQTVLLNTDPKTDSDTDADPDEGRFGVDDSLPKHVGVGFSPSLHMEKLGLKAGSDLAPLSSLGGSGRVYWTGEVHIQPDHFLTESLRINSGHHHVMNSYNFLKESIGLFNFKLGPV